MKTVRKQLALFMPMLAPVFMLMHQPTDAKLHAIFQVQEV